MPLDCGCLPNVPCWVVKSSGDVGALLGYDMIDYDKSGIPTCTEEMGIIDFAPGEQELVMSGLMLSISSML